MKFKSFRRFLLAAGVMAAAECSAEDLAPELEFVANPQMDRWPNNATARACLDLQFYRGRLFNGGGEVETNPGAPWISSIDPFDNSVRFEFAPGTEAIANYRIASWGDLLTPAQDPHEGDANVGHVFARAPDGTWTVFKSVGGSLKSSGTSNVANSTHCWDMEEFDGRVFVAGYNLMASTDRCKTFTPCTGLSSAYVPIVYATTSKKTATDNHLRRQIQLLRFGDSALFAVPNTLLQPNVMGDARTCNQEVFRYNASTHMFETISQRASDIYPDLTSSDYQLVGRNLTYFSTDTYARTLARIWHTTPFKGRVLYVGCYDTPPYSSVVSPWEDKIALTSYPLPLMGCSAAVVDNQIKATRISFGGDRENYPWDFAVAGNAVYALTSRYIPDGQKNRHVVWKSTDGVNFTEVLSFDFHQNFISIEYRDGWFYLGVGCKDATKGYAYDKTADESGSIYRVRCPQEPIQVVPSVDELELAEGASAKIAFRLSAQPASNLTLRVGATLANPRFATDRTSLTFTTENWSTPQEVTVSVPGNGALDANRSGSVVCGADGFDAVRGEFCSAELTSGVIGAAFTDAELVPPPNGEIRTADDFYCAMAYPDGDYKLMADIDLEGSLFTTIDEFAGTLDGNGFTLSGLGAGPIAKKFSGIVRNLTLDGEGAEVKGLSRGLFFDEADGGAFSNCTVKGYTLKAETSDAYLGLFVGVATGPISFCRCSTGADCLLNQANQHDTSLGGFVARVALPTAGGAHVTFEGCTNNAAISASDNYRTTSGAGGFVGVISGALPATPTNEVLFVRCVNEGPITSAGRNNCLGGLVGRFNATYNKKASVDTKFVLCANEADITVPENGTQSGSAGGFTGNVGSSNNIIFSQCTSTGTITAPAVITTGPFAAVGETTTNDALADEYPEPTIEDVDEPMEYCFYHELLNVPAMHAKGITGKGVRVGVVDDGIYPVIIGDKTNLTFAALAGATSSTEYHGTSVCSLIGSKKFGLAPDCEIWAYNSGDDQGQTGLNRTLTGIWWCATNGCRVINMSFGFAPDKYTDEQRIAFDTELAEIQRQTGVILINGNGNNPLNDLNYFPQDSECVIAIGGLKPDKTPAALTDSWRKDFCTFGDQVPDFIRPDGTVGMFDGTSCACPLATALAALLLQQEPTLTQDEIYGIFKASVEVLAPGRTREYGWGLLQACEVPANYKRQIEYDAEKAAWVNLQSVSITNKFVTYTSSDNFYEITMRTGSVIRLMLSDPMPANATDKTVYWYCGNNHAGKPILTDQILRAPDEIATVTEITINGQTIKLPTPNLENVYSYQGLNANYEPLFNLRVRLTTDPVEIPENEDPNYVPPVVSQDLTEQLEFVAYPAFVRYQGNNMNASSIIDLQVYHDLIFSGYGNWDGNQGPVTMVPLEPNLKTLTDEGELGTDSTETLRVFADGSLYVPATDRRESHANRGLFFRRNASGEWHTHTSIVVDNDVSTHFWDMMDFNGRLFLAGYGLASSVDGGTTWSRVESNPQNTRYLGFIKCGDELFCRDQSFIAFDYRTGKLVTGITNYNSYYWHWNKSTSLFDKINNNDYTEINGGVDRSSWALSNADLTNYSTTSGHPWHCTPFKDRSLYVLGSANAITVNGKKCAPSGTFPAVLITAWAENGMLKGEGVNLDGEYPYDLTVFGDAIYALTFKYKSDSQTVEHAVWKSTDGVSFAKILFFDFQQVMASLEYHNGYFYFGVAHLAAQPLLGTLAAKTDLSGRIYRVWCPQEKLRVVATPAATSVAEGAATQLACALSAKPASNVTLAVRRTDGNANFTVSPAALTFTPSNWNVAQNVTVSLADTATGDVSPAAITCGVETSDSVRGAFASTDVTPACVTLTPMVNDFAPTLSSVEIQSRLVPATVTASFESFGAENGVPKTSGTLVATVYADAAKSQVVASFSAPATALSTPVTLTLEGLEPGRLYTIDVTAKTTDALATVETRGFTAPIAANESDLADLTDDLTHRASITGNSNVRPYDSSGAWDNTTTVTFGGYKRPNYSVYEFAEPTVANGFGLLGIAGQQESRMPLNYSFAGSNDTNGEWTVLISVTNAPVWGAEGEWRRHSCDNTTAYRFYKVSLDENRVKGAGDAHVYAAEAELYFIADSEEPVGPTGLNNLEPSAGDRFALPLQQTWPAADYGAEVCLWQYDRYAALSFGHDDNCDWDIPFLLREAERNGIRLTWWLITKNIGDTGSLSGSGNWPEWRECFAAGHAIESHSHTHEWHGGGRTVPDAAAETGMSVEDYVEFCMYSNSLAVIREKIPGCKPSTLAFPGGEVYPEIANRYFVSGRSTSPYINRANAINYQSVNASSGGINPACINVVLGGRGGSKALSGWMKSFNDEKNYRGWLVPFQHTESTHDGLPNAGHEQGVAEQIQRMALLGQHRRHLWLGTYPAIAKYGQSRDTATLTVGTKTAAKITFTLTDQMRDDWYDEPLTVKVRLPSAWAQCGVAATQGGVARNAFYIEHEGAKYALVNAVPDRGEVTLLPAASNSGTWDETSYETPTYTYQVRFREVVGSETNLLKTIIAHPIGTSAAGEAPVLYKPGHRLSWATEDGVALDDVTDDVDFKAVWTATDERPKAVFVDENGQTLTIVETVYGTRPAQPTDLPAREGCIAYWEPELGPLVGNTEFTVRYMPDDDPIDGAIIVRTAEEFCNAMADHPSATIRMVRDIDLAGYGYTATPRFSGTFKAYGHVLSGLGAESLCVTNSGTFAGLKVIGDSDSEHPVLVNDYGVFAAVSEGGHFTDCRVDGYAIRANAQNVRYGVFAATATEGTVFSNCTVGATCSVSQGGKPNNEIGGFVGELKVAVPSGVLIEFVSCTNEAAVIATGDYNTAHGDGGFIGRAVGCGAADAPDIIFVNCADTGLVSSSGGNSNLGGYIGLIQKLTSAAGCTVTFEGCTTTLPVGTGACNSLGEWIGSGANAVVEHREYIPPEPPPDDPVVPPDEPVYPPEEFVTNDWFTVEFADIGYNAGTDWIKTSTDRSGGSWSGDDGGATELDGTARIVTLSGDFKGELRYTACNPSEAGADVIVEGSMTVSAAQRELRPADAPFALTFESSSAAGLTPVACVGGEWSPFGCSGFAENAWVDWKVEVDQTGENAPRLRITVSENGGVSETSGWLAGGFDGGTVSSVSYIGTGSFGDFKARYLTKKGGGEVVELAVPEFAAGGSALGFEPGPNGTDKFTLRISNPVTGAYYTVLTSDAVGGPYLPDADSALFEGGDGGLVFRVDADTPQKFAKILVSDRPYRKGEPVE